MPSKNPGPIPKRSEQRRRTNTYEGLDRIQVADERRGPDLPASVGDPHPLAYAWYESLRESGQAYYYEPSDWAQAAVWTQILSDQLRQMKVSAMVIQAWSNGAAELLTTEGTRRRMRLELLKGNESDEDDEAAVLAIDDYQKRLGGATG
jgi:hypothetical protein